MASSAYEVLFGGASGGGKSAAIIAAGLRWVHVPYFRSLILRRETTQLQDLLDKSRALYPKAFPGCVFNANTNTWIFPSGARIRFNHCKEESDKYDYQGQEFQLVIFDELTHFTQGQYLEIASRIRSAGEGLPRYLRATSNPGGSGHEWVFKRFGAWLDPKFEAPGLPIRYNEQGERVPPAEPGQKLWIVTTRGDGEVYVPPGTPNALSRQFIPALLKDNPKLLENDPNYQTKIMQMDPVRRAQLLDGNWLITAGKKLYFDRAWVTLVDAADLPPDLRWVRAWDLAATSPSLDNPDPDWTRGVLMARWEDSVVIGDVASIRGGPGAVDAFLRSTAERDGRSVVQILPLDPGAGGKIALAHYQNLLFGYPVESARATVDKLTRFRPFSGYAAPPKCGVRVVRAAWNAPYFDELEAFEGKDRDRDDQVDATSDAFNALAAAVTVYPMDDEFTAIDGYRFSRADRYLPSVLIRSHPTMPVFPVYGDALAREQAQHRVRVLSQTISHADLVAAATTQVVNLGSPLPSGAIILGRTLVLATAFSGGGASAVSVDIGGTDADAIVDGESLFTGATAAKAGVSGIDPNGLLGGQQLTATFISDVNVEALTAGSVTIHIVYCVPATA